MALNTKTEWAGFRNFTVHFYVPMGSNIVVIRGNQTGRCPHCKVGVRFERCTVIVGGNQNPNVVELRVQTPSVFMLDLAMAACPECGRPIVGVTQIIPPNQPGQPLDSLLWPDTGARPVPIEVEQKSPNLAEDFREASCVFPKSKKASAALSRRCLQFILREEAGTKSKDLSAQINEVLDRLPSELASNVDAIRHVGNFAAHPIKSTNSGEIVEVEEGEAEWLLDVLEELFDFYYVAPIKAALRRDALNKKLQEAGKPLMKAPNGEKNRPTKAID